ncbi:MAG: DUF167 domain-containing protein [Planctomycetaceae bacterium]|nr:DUF167 domain-containing protein [Planctomycetaceae bacterium]
MPEALHYTSKDNGIVITVKVVPGSSRSEVVGLHGGMLKVKVAAAPEKGKANKALVEFLAKALHLKKTDLEITAGHTASVKQVFLAGASVDAIEAICKNK